MFDQRVLDRRIVFADAQRVVTVLRGAGFEVSVRDVTGKTPRELAWTWGETARRRKIAVELLTAALDSI